VAWAIFVAGHVLSVDLTGLGIYPRRFLGLWGVAFAPFVHGDLRHLVSNSVPFIILFTSISFFYQRVAARVVPLIYVGTGAAVWLLARPSYHVGASGIIYGLAAFLFFSGVFRGSLPSLVIAVAVVVLYGGMVEGIFPRQEGVSWESHLAGAVLGAVVAYQARHEREPEEKDVSPAPSSLADGPPEGYRNLAGRRFKYEYRERPKAD
jgi:membrane associated rhomboid family serine protease